MSKDIIRMANEAAIGHPEVDPEDIPPLEGEDLALFERFADLIRADERETCAKACESNVWSKNVAWWKDATKSEVSVESGVQCAAAIRARGNK